MSIFSASVPCGGSNYGGRCNSRMSAVAGCLLLLYAVFYGYILLQLLLLMLLLLLFAIVAVDCGLLLLFVIICLVSDAVSSSSKCFASYIMGLLLALFLFNPSLLDC